MPTTNDTRYYAVRVSNQATSARGTCWVWSKPFARPKEAAAECRRCLDAGEATTAFVVEAVGNARKVWTTYIWPISARKIIAHYIELLELCAAPR